MSEKVETITKERITDYLQNTLGLSSLLCEEVVNAFFKELEQQVINDSSITINNLGKFFLNTKQPRPGKNVKTGEFVEVPGRTVLRFTPSRALKNKL